MVHTGEESTGESLGRRCFSRGLWTWKGLFPWRPGAWPLRGARGSHSPARAETRQGSLRRRPPHSGRHRAASVRGAFEWLEGRRAPWDGCLRAPLAAHRRLPCVSGIFWSPSVETLGDERAPRRRARPSSRPVRGPRPCGPLQQGPSPRGDLGSRFRVRLCATSFPLRTLPP